MRTTNGTTWSAVTMACYADLIRAGKELGCVAESARKTDTVEIEEIMSGVRSQKVLQEFFCTYSKIGSGWVGALSSHTKSARMAGGSGSPGPHGDYLIGLRAYNEKTPQRKRDTKKTASEGGF